MGSLFSGIGWFDLGLERAGFDIAWQVEHDDYCRRVLAKHWPGVPCHYDVRTIDWAWLPRVDLICGGFPCQPFSCAGKRRGADDDRYLWPEVVRCLSVQQPAWFLGENVPGLIGLGLDQVLADLEGLGYETQTFSIPACAVDAQHIRQRLWILSYLSRIQSGRKKPRTTGQRTRASRESCAYANTERAERRPFDIPCHHHRENGNAQWEESPDRTGGLCANVADTKNSVRG
ncbi:MAG TPA: DNA cytosine methyltransferase, partial [Candidatus Krumholzibacteria bacterium]|nr:DNA cytosine methyltransferase [Candidatus Krumholzibacteria bacterium]